MRREGERSPLLPNPTSNVRRMGENDDFLRLDAEVCQIEFVKDSNVVVGGLYLGVTTNYYVTLNLGDDTFLHFFLEYFAQ